MALVTLIGEKLAKKDCEFIYIGPNNDCRNCKLKTVCFNLKKGRKYKITNVRDKKHNCNVHEGTAIVVEVQELPLITTISDKHKQNTKTKIEKDQCNSIGCKYYDLCSIPIQNDKIYNIVKIFENIDCPLGHNIQKAELKEEQ